MLRGAERDEPCGHEGGPNEPRKAPEGVARATLLLPPSPGPVTLRRCLIPTTLLDPPATATSFLHECYIEDLKHKTVFDNQW